MRRSLLALSLVASSSLACELLYPVSDLTSGADAADAGATGADADGSPPGDATPRDATTIDAACPAGFTQVLEVGARGAYCVATFEVTRAYYLRFVDACPTAYPEAPSGCENNATFVPAFGWPPATDADGRLPVVGVDWCDAYAYCLFSGFRLCGRIGGGAVNAGDDRDPTKSQWFNACSRGGAHAYPYGDAYEPAACNGADHGAMSVVAYDALATCTFDQDGPYEMSGNVAEWEDACESRTASATCHVRGGSYLSGEADLTCGAERLETRTSAHSDVGFRCCL